MKIKQLNAAQKAKIPIYIQKGIDMLMSTGADMDEQLVRDLTEQHRKKRGLPPAVNFLVKDSPMQAILDVPGLAPDNALYGCHDISWLIYFDFFKNECGLKKEVEGAEALFELAKHVSWLWISSDTTVVTRKPVEIHCVAGDKTVPGIDMPIFMLHNTEGPAILYADGWGVFCIDGQVVGDTEVYE